MALRGSVLPPRLASLATELFYRPPILSRPSMYQPGLLRLSLPALLSATFLPAFQLRIPSLLGDLWESVLRAVPKKKTSHRKKRQRFLAGKGLKDVTALNKCPACGNVKRAHLLCPYCVREIRDIWLGRAKPRESALTKEATT